MSLERTKEIVEALGGSVDDNTTTQEEYNKQITERQQIDMSSDSWLSKNIRPLVLLWLMGLFTWSFIHQQLTGKQPDIAFVNLLTSLLTTAIMFYFGSRAAEKISKIVARGNTKVGVIKTKNNRPSVRERLFGKK